MRAWAEGLLLPVIGEGRTGGVCAGQNLRLPGRLLAAGCAGLFLLIGASCSHAPPPAAGAVALPHTSPPPPPAITQIQAAEADYRAHPNSASAGDALASLYLAVNKLPDAVRTLQQVERVSPGDAQAHRLLAQVFDQAGYLDLEIDEREALLQADPSNAENALELGSIYMGLGWLRSAKRVLNVAQSAAPRNPQVFAELAGLKLAQEDPAGAEKIARQGLTISPADAGLLSVLAESLRLQGRLPEAEQALRGAMKSAPSEALDKRLAFLLLDPRWHPLRTADAEAAARAAIAADPGDPEAHYWLGRALQIEGNTAEAEKEYAVTASTDATFEQVALYLGQLYSREPARAAEAKRLVAIYASGSDNAARFKQTKQAVIADPASTAAHRNMAGWYLRTGDVPHAIAELKMALLLSPRDAKSRDLLIEALNDAHRYTEARELERGHSAGVGQARAARTAPSPRAGRVGMR